MLPVVLSFWFGGAVCTAIQLYGFTRGEEFADAVDVLQFMAAIVFWPVWNMLIFLDEGK